jgi:predicted RNase H-like nuclease
VQRVVLEASADRAFLTALAAELQALRHLHREARRVLRAPLEFSRALDALPAVVGDTAAWRDAMQSAHARFDKYGRGETPAGSNEPPAADLPRILRIAPHSKKDVDPDDEHRGNHEREYLLAVLPEIHAKPYPGGEGGERE